jgi:predicted peptidase
MEYNSRCKWVIVVAVISVFSHYPLKAQLSEKYKGYEEHYYKGMRYGLFKPKDYDAKRKYPLVVYLHGSTDTVSRDLNWYQESSQKEFPCLVLTPKCEEGDQGWGNTWREQHTAATAKTLSLTDSLIKSYSIDTNRLYLYGISMGGFGVFSILQKDSGKFAAAFAVCGGSSPKAAAKIKGTPLWIFHGAMDDVVPVHLSRDIYKEIVKLGGKLVQYTEYPGVKHNSWENVSREKTLSKWLFSQVKGKPRGSSD